MTSRSAETERRQLQLNAQTGTREITAAIGRQIVALHNTLTVLAASAHLEEEIFVRTDRAEPIVPLNTEHR